jgi:hypothetical protein
MSLSTLGRRGLGTNIACQSRGELGGFAGGRGVSPGFGRLRALATLVKPSRIYARESN